MSWRRCTHWTVLAITAACAMCAGRTCLAQQEFRLLVDGDPGLSSTAVLSGQELIVTDAQGVVFRYVREPQFDTPDGQFVGFYNAAAQQPLRWPTAGQGAMLISDPQGQNWRASAQRVQPAGVPGGPLIRPRPVMPADPRIGGPAPGGAAVPNPQLGQFRRQGVAGGIAGGPMHIGIGVDARRRPRLGWIDSDGIVQVFGADRGGWSYQSNLTTPGLIPGASLLLTPDVVPGLSRVTTIDAAGTLTTLSKDQGAIPLAPELRFPPAAVLAGTPGDPERRAFAVDATGQLWDLACHFDRLGRPHGVIDNEAGLLVPGAPITVLSTLDPTTGRPQRTLWLTDSRGSIQQYQSHALGGWSPRLELAVGFVPGAPVGAAVFPLPDGQRPLYLAAVDWRGGLQLLYGSPIDLRVQTLDSGTLPPGAHVLVLPPGGTDPAGATLDGPLLSAIGVDGVWRVWRPGVGGAWDVTTLHGGFSPGAPVVSDPVTGDLLAIDVRGRVIPARWQGGGWQNIILHPTFPQAPRLVSRRIVPNPPLPPATVTLINGGDEELAVQVADAEVPAQSLELKIAPRGAQTQQFERDAGATVEEVYLVPDPIGGWSEQMARYPLPPQPRYSLAVWAKRTTYQYINKNPNKPKGALPDFDLKSHVSLGVLDLPPGDLLRDGEQIDIHRAAVSLRNPGAAGYLPVPSGGPTVVPK
jgi:hypothetical protein